MSLSRADHSHYMDTHSICYDSIIDSEEFQEMSNYYKNKTIDRTKSILVEFNILKSINYFEKDSEKYYGISCNSIDNFDRIINIIMERQRELIDINQFDCSFIFDAEIKMNNTKPKYNVINSVNHVNTWANNAKVMIFLSEFLCGPSRTRYNVVIYDDLTYEMI